MGRAIKQDDSKMGRAIKQKFEWGGPQNKNSSGEGRKAKFRARRATKTPFFALRVPIPIPRLELNQETGHYKTYSEMSSQTKTIMNSRPGNSTEFYLFLARFP